MARFTKKIDNMIAELRGLPSSASILPRHTQPDSIDDLMSACLRSLRPPEQQILETLLENWCTVVHAPYTHKSAPQKLINGKTLLIACADHLTQSELHFKRKEIFTRIQELTEPGSIKIIQILAR